MSKYTTEVRFICESLAGVDGGYASVQEVIQKSVDKIFDFDYPIFNPEYRNVLNTKILKHYYTREIGEETYGLWKLRLDTRMNEIMPYFNKMYESELLEFDPLIDVSMTTTRTVKDSGTNTVDGTTTTDTDKTITGERGGTNEEQENGTKTGTTTIDTDKTVTGERGGTNEEQENGTKTGTTDREYNKEGTSSQSDTQKFNDTPQGGLDGIMDNQYLTNVTMNSGSKNFEENGSDSETLDLADSRSKDGSFTETSTVEENGSNSETLDLADSRSKDGSFTETSTVEENGSVMGTRKDVTTIDTTEEYLEKVTGKSGGTSYMKLVRELRENFLNIDMQIIESLSDLFMRVW